MTMKKSKRITSAMLTVVLVLGLLTASPVLASAEDTVGMAVGTWAGSGANPGDGHRYIDMGNYNGRDLKWRVLDVYISDGTDGNAAGSKTAFLLLDDLLRTPSGEIDKVRFNAHNSNWSQPSELNELLNDRFFNGAFNAEEQAGIITADYGMGGPYEGNYGFPAFDSSKVFMLSTDEAASPAYFADDTDRAAECDWWLRSPGDSDTTAAYVNLGGSAIGAGFNYFFNYIGVRPAVKINLGYGISDLAIGTWAGTGENPGDGHRQVTMGSYNSHMLVWRVLDVYISDGTDGNSEGSKTALLLLDDLLRTPSGEIDKVRFNAHNSNWSQPSELNVLLNDRFFNGAFSADEQARIITATYRMGGSYEGNYGFPALDSSKVFMLSTDEAASPAYFAGDVDRAAEYDWWLRSPGDSDTTAAYVNLGGSVIGAGFNYFFNYIGLRPALKVNLTTVNTPLCGDVDGNGRVAPMDATLLSRYLAGWPDIVINMAAADVDGDGEVTIYDLAILQRHIAGWPGYETLPYQPPSQTIF